MNCFLSVGFTTFVCGSADGEGAGDGDVPAGDCVGPCGEGDMVDGGPRALGISCEACGLSSPIPTGLTKGFTFRSSSLADVAVEGAPIL